LISPEKSFACVNLSRAYAEIFQLVGLLYWKLRIFATGPAKNDSKTCARFSFFFFSAASHGVFQR
jgi:hypothetical protein